MSNAALLNDLRDQLATIKASRDARALMTFRNSGPFTTRTFAQFVKKATPEEMTEIKALMREMDDTLLDFAK